MIENQTRYNLLICLILVSFGFFGSISHVFTLALLIFTYFSRKALEHDHRFDFTAKIVFWLLNGCFVLFFFSTLLRSNLSSLINSMSPMMPLPVIGILITFQIKTGFKLNSKQTAQFSKISVLFSFIVYILLSFSTNPNNFFYEFNTDRLSLFSGNPIPFSFVMLGLSIFCLSNWKNSDQQDKLTALLFFFVGAYMSAFLSGTRGTLLALIIISPVVVFYLTNSLRLSVFIILNTIFIVILIIKAVMTYNLEIFYITRIIQGFETIITHQNNDIAIFQRLEMWSAAMKSISEQPFFGYGITERFSALKPYLNNSTFEYTHPHNDIFAGSIASGFAGGIATTITIISTLISALIAPQRSNEKVLLGLMLTIVALTTASVSTLLFNDISCAWLAFSTYLIWTTDFKENNS